MPLRLSPGAEQLRPVAPTRRPAGAPSPPVALRDLPLLTWLPVGAMLALLGLGLLDPSGAARLALPIALAGALVGVPHGAVDHLVPRSLGPAAGRRPGPGPGPGTARFVAAYAAVALAALAAYLLAPTPMLVVFLGLSAVHFGRGEVVAAAERAGRPVPGLGAEWAMTTAFGAGVVGLLLWARPASVEPYLRPVSPWLADVASDVRPAGLVVVTAAAVVGAGSALGRRRPTEAAELVLVLTTFAAVPPLAAFGLYFGSWHALRHTGRLLDLAREHERAAGRADPGWAAAARVVARASLVPTVVAVAAMGALWWWGRGAGLPAEVAVLLALTFPHAAVVWGLDRRAARR